MGIDNGESGAVVNEKNEHYAAMPMTWQAKNNRAMNEKMGYNVAADMANTAAPPTPIKMEKNNRQLGPQAEDNQYDYDKNRG